MDEVACPFCGFKSIHEYAIQLHIEEHHTEDSPFAVNELAAASHTNGGFHNASSSEESMPEDTWTKCTRPDCGEYVLLSDVDDHLELHKATALSEQNDRERERPKASSRSQLNRTSTTHERSPQKLHKRNPSENSDLRSNRSLLDYFSGTSCKGQPTPAPRRRRIEQPRQPGRLGKRELGPHAFEKVMPAEVRRRLLNDALPYSVNRIGRDGRTYRESVVDNETSGILPVLADLCALDPSTEATYLCDRSVKHITKLRCDGNFCGYWNVQVLLSYLHSRGDSSRDQAQAQRMPDVLLIQDTIEQAWDNGICSYGRIETGGVRGTRKWIGTHEALAYFTQIGVKVEALSFKEEDNANIPANSSQPAVIGLLDHVEAYFMSGVENSKKHGTSHATSLAPIYFQRFGHSMTIVGLERKRDGSRNLLVFDSSFATTQPLRMLLAGRSSRVAPETLLRVYRRSDLSLRRWDEFEIVVPHPSTGVKT